MNGLDLGHVGLIETRLLVRRESGWVALPYVWNAEGTDATLERTGADVPLTLVDGATRTPFDYSVPNQNQCGGCHVQDFRTRAIEPIGLKARHLNRTFPGEGGEINQLRRLAAEGYLTGVPGSGVPQDANWQDASASVDARARAYLDINCSHCHNRVGRGAHLRPVARCGDQRRAPARHVQAAGRGGARHGRPAVRCGAGQAR